MNKELRVLSLFSGIGAFEKALTNIKASHRLVNYCEIDKYAAKAYSLIHNIDESLNLGDIKLVNEDLKEDFDVMTWGFPCTDISVQNLPALVNGSTAGTGYRSCRSPGPLSRPGRLSP
jgi:DNA (cytosine-5)-methyltransferase 1